MTDSDLRAPAGSDAEAPSAVRMRDVVGGVLGALRFEPVTKRVRATLGGETVVDSVRAVLVWEPRRVVPGYAVPEDDISAEIRPSTAAAPQDDGEIGYALPNVTDLLVLDPRVPFGVRSTAGTPVDITSSGGQRAEGFRPSDPALAGYVILAFGDFDEWFEEDEKVISHPHDPFSRIDVRATSRRLQVVHEGQVIADTTRARMLFETGLPARYYLPIDDVHVPLRQSATRTMCAYKGEATYYSLSTEAGEVDDAAWQYENPLVDATDVSGLVSFFDERFDVVIDGTPRERPKTPWS